MMQGFSRKKIAFSFLGAWLTWRMTKEDVRDYFSRPAVVADYARATNAVGLWNSEEKLFTRLFNKEDTLLELGCGTGRIAFGLWELGYRNILASDVSRAMIKEARRINKLLDYGVPTAVADATALAFGDNEYEGAIFGFNGLMQIPGRANRRKAMQEIFRVLVPGAWFVFTTHDRNAHGRKNFWKKEKNRWDTGTQDPRLLEYGDITYVTDDGGTLFIHSPVPDEIREDCKLAGFRVEADILRSQLGPEPDRVVAFSDDCRFWVVQKPH